VAYIVTTNLTTAPTNRLNRNTENETRMTHKMQPDTWQNNSDESKNDLFHLFVDMMMMMMTDILLTMKGIPAFHRQCKLCGASHETQ